MIQGTATLLLSGGQDSYACLLWSLKNFARVEAVTLAYGQRHEAEIESAKLLAKLHETSHTIHTIGSFFEGLASSSLLSSQPDHLSDSHPSAPDLPASFVPGRNGILLSAAGAIAFSRRAGEIHLVIGACETDYSGYPDCRGDYLKAKETELGLGFGRPVTIHAPLLKCSKADVFRMAREAGRLREMLEQTLTCYRGILEEHPWGRGCGTCPSCRLRAQGYADFLEQGA